MSSVPPITAMTVIPCDSGDPVRFRRFPRFPVCGLIAIVASAVAASAAGAPQGSANSKSGPSFRATIPAGYTIVQLNPPSGSTMELMGLVECQEIEGSQQISEGLNAKVISSQGVLLTHFPRHFSFRVTATLRKLIQQPPEQFVNTGQDPREFLLNLGFRLKIYDGLNMQEMEPESVTIIGMPSDISYDERVFRIEFSVGNLPVTDRVLLEVLSPQGETISHFTFAIL